MCDAVQMMILSLFVAAAVICAGFEVWKCDLEGLESRNCLAGLLDVCTPMELPA